MVFKKYPLSYFSFLFTKYNPKIADAKSINLVLEQKMF